MCNRERAIAVASATDLLLYSSKEDDGFGTSITSHPLGRARFGAVRCEKQMLSTYGLIALHVFVHKPYYLEDTEVDALVVEVFEPRHDSLYRYWKKLFESLRASIDWSTYRTNGTLVLKNASTDTATTTSIDNNLTLRQLQFANKCRKELTEMHKELESLNTTASNDALKALRTELTPDMIRFLLFFFNDLYDLHMVQSNVHRARSYLNKYDLVHAREYETSCMLYHTARYRSYQRLLNHFANFMRMRDWNFIVEYFCSPYQRKIETYNSVLDTLSLLSGNFTIKTNHVPIMVNLTTLMMYRQARILMLHDLTMRYMIRRYFLDKGNPRATVHPYEPLPDLDEPKVRFFIWLVNRAFVNDGCYQETTEQLHDSVFWQRIFAHCAVQAPSAFISQILMFVAPLHSRLNITCEDVLDYVDWLCSYDPWYMGYTCSIIERMRMFSENKLRKQFTSLYEAECILFFLLVGNRCDTLERKIYYVSRNISKDYTLPDHQQSAVFDQSRTPHTPLPSFNWLLNWDRIYDSRVFQNTIEYCLNLTKEYMLRYDSKVQVATNERRTMDAATPQESVDFASHSRAARRGGGRQQQQQQQQQQQSQQDPRMQIVQTILNFLNDICMFYNGGLVHKSNANNREPTKQAFWVDTLKRTNDEWNKDPKAQLRIAIKDLNLDLLEDSCYRQRTTERPSKVIGNALSSNSTSKINTSYLRIIRDTHYGFIIHNIQLHRYEIAAPTLMYLMTLNYGKWALSDADSFPSAVNPAIHDYVQLVLENVDTYLSNAISVDGLSMMLYTDIIPLKHTGDSSGMTTSKSNVLAKAMNNNNNNEETQPLEDDDDAPPQKRAKIDDDSDLINSVSNTTAYVDFLIDRREYFNLAAHLRPEWVYRFCEKALAKHSETTSPFVQYLVLLMQLFQTHGFDPLAKESFFDMLVDEFFLACIPDKLANDYRANNRNVAQVMQQQQAQQQAQQVQDPSTQPQQQQQQQHHLPSIATFYNFCVRYSIPDKAVVAATIVESDPKELDKFLLHENPDFDPDRSAGQEKTQDNGKWSLLTKHNVETRRFKKPSSHMHEILIERDVRQMYQTLLNDESFSAWFDAQRPTLDHILNLGDNTVCRFFATYIFFLRTCVRYDKTPLTDQDNFVNRVLRNSTNCLQAIRQQFPCSFIVSRDTASLASGLVAYLERVQSRPLQRHSQEDDSNNDETSVVSSAVAMDTEFQTSYESFQNFIAGILGTPKNAADHLQSTNSSNKSEANDARGTYIDARNVPLDMKKRTSICCFILMIHIFCASDIGVTLYKLRYLMSIMYPGSWARTIGLCIGSSNSGKSNMYNMIRSFYNSESGVLRTQSMQGVADGIGTQFLPLSENFLCQIDELKEADTETLKTVTSDTPLQARSFHSQKQQTVSIMASLVITLNQMFRIVSDEGVLERLRVVFHLMHRHLEPIRKESDMTKLNCGASLNVSHQFTQRVFPRGISQDLFQSGMFYVMRHWGVSQVTSPEERFIHADRVASLQLATLLSVDIPQFSRFLTGETDDRIPCLNYREAWRTVCNERENLSSLSPDSLFVGIFRRFQQQYNDIPTNTGEYVNSRSLLPNLTSCSLYEHHITPVDELEQLFQLSLARLSLRFQRYLLYTNFSTIANKFTQRFSTLYPKSNFICLMLNTLHPSLKEDKGLAGIDNDALTLLVRDDAYDDNHVNLMVKPYILDLYLANLQSKMDPFVRFQSTYKVLPSERTITTDSLKRQLQNFLDQFNANIDDYKYKIKFNEFYDRFETEYQTYKFRDPRSGQYSLNLWAIKLKEIIVPGRK
nr:MAG: hypothetical protein [Apis mellifra filamentous-like virus]